MKVAGATALVTGANRGLGAAIAQALVDSGAKVYGAARDNTTITNPDVIPVLLDVTSPDDIANAARICGDISILVNNAGIGRSSTSLAPDATDAARAELETNYFGPMHMARAFAPILRQNGGGVHVARGDDLVVVASAGGSDTTPNWYKNLLAAGGAEVQVGADRWAVAARELDDGPERDECWSLAADVYPGFDSYQRFADRQIPVAVLERRAG
jgi:deazaflavin-dependent oxidoreductase (nitroreductase family)